MDAETTKRIADYALIHLGDIGGRTEEITSDISEILQHPHRNAGSETRLELARKLARENLEYISQGLSDLDFLELEAAKPIKVPRTKGRLRLYKP